MDFLRSRSLLFVAFFMIAIPARSDEPVKDVVTVPAVEDFLVIPLRLHVLQSEDIKSVDCLLKDDDLRRILGKVNSIWNKAGIHWGLESIIHEPADEQEKFRLAAESDDRPTLGLYRILIPEKTREFDGLHVYYLHDFAVNGVWLGEDYALVKETAKLREVEGGIDEPIPRVTAHELGHILSLPHRQDQTNLLASGTTGTLLNSEEIKNARAGATSIKGVRTYRELLETADGPDSKLPRIWISEIEQAVKPKK